MTSVVVVDRQGKMKLLSLSHCTTSHAAVVQEFHWSMLRPPSDPSYVVVACDATRDRNEHDIKLVIGNVRANGVILSAGDRLLVLCVLHKVSHPMGYQTLACPESFAGTNFRSMEEEVRKKVDVYANELLSSLEDFEIDGVSIDVQVTAGFPIRQVILQEVTKYNASWIILDRYLRRDLRYHLDKMPCKVALVKDDLSVDIWRSQNTHDRNVTATKLVYSLSKFVSLSDCHSMEDIEQSIISCKSYPHSVASSDSSGIIKSYSVHSYASRSREHSSSLDSGSSSQHERSGISIQGKQRHSMISHIGQKQNKRGFLPRTSDAPILCAGCGARTELSIKESMRLTYSEIQLATNDFSKDNLIGEGGFGHVYKGVLKDGQQIAAKVRKEGSTQGFSEFHSEVYVLSFARHKNIVMLLGYCCKENKNILIYEYICNKSLHWHLFENTAAVLDWHQRYAIAIGTAKGLRFLHEECRGGPIIHRDMRPSNILLTHDFVPMLGDFGLAKWNTGDNPLQTRIMGTLGYLKNCLKLWQELMLSLEAKAHCLSCPHGGGGYLICTRENEYKYLAPEYAEDGIVSEGTDVYSYGVTLLQLISGRKVGNSNDPQQQQSLRQWSEPIIKKLALQELVDPRLGESYDTYELYLMAKAAYFCMQRKPEMRPSMGEVVRLLEGESNHFHSLEDQFVPNY